MSDYSEDRLNKAYGAVTRVVIASPERVQHASPPTTWRTTDRPQQLHLALPHDDGQRQSTTTRLISGSENRPTAARKDVVVKADAVQTSQQLQRQTRPRHQHIDEWQRMSSVVEHVNVARQQINMVRLACICDDIILEEFVLRKR